MPFRHKLKIESTLKSILDLKSALGRDTAIFLNEMAYINFVRLRAFTVICGFVFSPLFLLDIFYMFSGKWEISFGYKILFYSHLSVLILVSVSLIFYRMHPAGHPNQIKTPHKSVVDALIFAGLFNIVAISFGDILINGSLAAYLGALFAFASIFMMTNFFSALIFLSNMSFMVVFLITASLLGEYNFSIQIINAVAFAIVSIVLSRIIFYYQIRDFKARRTIEGKNAELQIRNEELRSALSNNKTLKGLLPICSHCKKIRDDKGYWNRIEAYIQEHSEASFSHGICVECLEKYYPDDEI
jgi:hypothetical protein